MSNVVIEDHVWIGARATVMLPGVRIGRGAVVAAGPSLRVMYRLIPWSPVSLLAPSNAWNLNALAAQSNGTSSCLVKMGTGSEHAVEYPTKMVVLRCLSPIFNTLKSRRRYSGKDLGYVDADRLPRQRVILPLSFSP